MAFMSSTIVNTAIRTNSKNGKLTSVADFMPDFDVTAPKEAKKQSVEEMKRILLEIAGNQNKAVERREKIAKRKKLKDKDNG